MKTSKNSIITIENLIESYEPEFGNISDPAISRFLGDLQNIVASSNSLILKSVNDLLPLHFFVDDYQRGYKWLDGQVKDLLNDINEFEISNEGFYCLQPVVVKHHSAKQVGERGCWELIDGQQRMTTVFMILKYLEHTESFKIDYQTRESSSVFLKNHLSETLPFDSWDGFIKNLVESEQLDNVDNYHFYNAYQVIHSWFSNVLPEPSDQKAWLNKLLNHTKVIWYAARDEQGSIDKKSSIDIFMRINSGKIPLTNAELIKALFLQGITGGDKSELSLLKQQELSLQWDMIEHGLQNEEFWGFLSGNQRRSGESTRIDLLFDLLSGKRKTKSYDKKALSEQDNYFAFNFFSEKLKGQTDEALQCSVLECWHEIKEGYYRLLEWFSDDELYHLVGFVINRGLLSIESLWEKSKEKDKSSFKDTLKGEIASKIREYFSPSKGQNLDFFHLSYETAHRSKIISVLMLLNIQVHRNNKTRLSFKTFQSINWDIEHIHAQQSQELLGHAKIETWFSEQESTLNNAKDHIRPEQLDLLKTHLKAYKAATDDSDDAEKSRTLLDEYYQLLSETFGEMKDEDIDELDNLCLLSPKVNRGIGNHVFPLKREKIIDYERKGNFIPIATKNVFSKFYSQNVAQMHKWSSNDRLAYKSAIVQALAYYGNMEGLE